MKYTVITFTKDERLRKFSTQYSHIRTCLALASLFQVTWHKGFLFKYDPNQRKETECVKSFYRCLLRDKCIYVYIQYYLKQ